MKYQEQANLQRQKNQSLPGTEKREKMEVTTNVISFGGDENIPNLDCGEFYGLYIISQ